MILECEYKRTPHTRPFSHTIYMRQSNPAIAKKFGFTPNDRVIIDTRRWISETVSSPLKVMLSGGTYQWQKYRDRSGNYHYRFCNKEDAMLFKLAFHGRTIEQKHEQWSYRWTFV